MKRKSFIVTAVLITLYFAMFMTTCDNPFLPDEEIEKEFNYGGTKPDVPTGVYASSSSSGLSITISWASVYGTNSYIVYRSTSSTGTYSQIATSTSTLYTNTGLSAGTTYYYKVAAKNNSGTSSQSLYASATTLSVPGATIGLERTAATSSSITMRWTSVSGATSYYVYRSLSSTGTYSQIGNTTSTSYQATGLSANTTYYFKVAAYNAAGTGPQSSFILAATTEAAPITPTGITVTTVSHNSIMISWASVSNALGYNVYRSSTSTGTYTKIGTSITTTSYTDSGILAGTTYYYKVDAYNNGGSSSQSSAVLATTLPNPALQAPTGFNVTTATSSSITISWSPVSGATSYYVYRSSTSTGTYTQIGTPMITSYTDSGLSAGTTYYYKVAASNNEGIGPQSSDFSAITAPGIPSGLKTTDSTVYSITISWNAVAGATSYNVYRSSSSSGTYTELGNTIETSYTDNGLSGMTTYYYKVAAINNSGTGTQSSAFSATTQHPSLKSPTGLITTGATSSSITISWNAVDNAVEYYVYRSANATTGYSRIGTTASTSYTNTGLSSNAIYHYFVAANNSDGIGPSSYAVSAQTHSSSSYYITITGTPRVGQTLTASTYGTGWTTGSVIQWAYCSTTDGSFYYINGATGSYFTVSSAYAGYYIRAFRYHPSGNWTEYNGGVATGIKMFASNFLGPIQY